MDEEKTILIGLTLLAVTLILIISICWVGSIRSERQRIDNFENTISELSDEQKCIHICGFRFYGQSMFENYKFCMEKCDRISERVYNNYEANPND